MKKWFILLVMILPLWGCVAVPVALVAGATGGGGAVIYDKRGFETMRRDQNARAIAQNWINSDSLIKKSGSHILVTVFDQVGLLIGQAKTPAIRERAYQIVSRVKNIKRVYNEITVEKPASRWKKTRDAWITTKVVTKMVVKEGLRSTNLKVVTEAGVVYIMGVVTHKQAALAADVARRVSGVTKVVKVFEYEQ